MVIAAAWKAQGEGALAEPLLNALPHPILAVDAEGRIVGANDASESFFRMSRLALSRHRFEELVPFGSPVLHLVRQARERGASVKEYRVEMGTPHNGLGHVADVYVSPMGDSSGLVAVMLQERTMAEKIERQLTHRGAARSVTGLAAMLAHEIKNPLSGIRGAAQLLESSVEDSDRQLTRLICEEADRIVTLVDRMEVFSDERPIEREAVNLHSVLERVKQLAASGFARHIRIVEQYDPSLPPVYGNRDQLLQVFLNLVKNAAEAIGEGAREGEIVLASAFQPGIRLSVPGTSRKLSLPLEFSVRDNGPGVSEDIREHMFDPFVTTKTSGSGLGLALVAKIVGAHGGVIECDSQPRRTTFRVLLPMFLPEREREQPRSA
jgi:two-component system nitrogen regulation sensor histidine kinase GlnL